MAWSFFLLVRHTLYGFYYPTRNSHVENSNGRFMITNRSRGLQMSYDRYGHTAAALLRLVKLMISFGQTGCDSVANTVQFRNVSDPIE